MPRPKISQRKVEPDESRPRPPAEGTFPSEFINLLSIEDVHTTSRREWANSLNQLSMGTDTPDVGELPSCPWDSSLSWCDSASRWLCWLLRHGVSVNNLRITSQGYVAITEIMCYYPALFFSHFPTPAHLYAVVHKNPKQRMELSFGVYNEDWKALMVRARQGHSGGVLAPECVMNELFRSNSSVPRTRATDAQPPVITLPEIVVHGATREALPYIMQDGLLPGGRSGNRDAVHFAITLPEDNSTVVSGLRPRSDVLIFLNLDRWLSTPPNRAFITENNVVCIHTKVDRKFFLAVVDMRTYNVTNAEDEAASEAVMSFMTEYWRRMKGRKPTRRFKLDTVDSFLRREEDASRRRTKVEQSSRTPLPANTVSWEGRGKTDETRSRPPRPKAPPAQPLSRKEPSSATTAVEGGQKTTSTREQDDSVDFERSPSPSPSPSPVQEEKHSPRAASSTDATPCVRDEPRPRSPIRLKEADEASEITTSSTRRWRDSYNRRSSAELREHLEDIAETEDFRHRPVNIPKISIPDLPEKQMLMETDQRTLGLDLGSLPGARWVRAEPESAGRAASAAAPGVAMGC